MNNWGIPQDIEDYVRARDLRCIYCNIVFNNNERRSAASWEHIINDASIITIDNIALCCIGCNASKGQKKLEDWLNSDYCKSKGITIHSIAPIAQKYLASIGSLV